LAKIIISGASGLIGTALVPSLISQGHTVACLTRDDSQVKKCGNAPAVPWDPQGGKIDSAKLEGLDAVIHLAGENVSSGRWTEEKKARIRDSRVRGTGFLAETLARLARRPKTFICASAIGFYGNRRDEILRETSAPGTDFLAGVCREWEAATLKASEAGIRVAHLRFGVVLSPRGGALAKLLVPFKMGVGGKVGDGKQYMSWITLDDAIGVIEYALKDETLGGPVNVVAPKPVTNSEFTRTLGQVLGRPTLFWVPAFGARLAFGEMADELLLSSARVEPARLQAANYPFRYPELEGALRHLLSR